MKWACTAATVVGGLGTERNNWPHSFTKRRCWRLRRSLDCCGESKGCLIKGVPEFGYFSEGGNSESRDSENRDFDGRIPKGKPHTGTLSPIQRDTLPDTEIPKPEIPKLGILKTSRFRTP